MPTGTDVKLRTAQGGEAAPGTNESETSLQAAIDVAMARSFLYRFLAKAFEDPTEEGWEVLGSLGRQRAFQLAAQACALSGELAEAATVVQSHLEPHRYEPFAAAYRAAFGHAARGRCPLNEIEYGDIKADPLFQPHRLADLAAFYRAFGLDLADDAGERHDHICLELEFMCVLAAKEAYALEYQLEVEDLKACRSAQRRFLREHLGRWIPAFARRLAAMAGDSPLASIARLTGEFVKVECLRCGVVPGSEDLLLRAVDEAAENLCGSCGIPQAPPGASLPPTMA